MILREGYLIKYTEINENINTFIDQIDRWTAEFQDVEEKYLNLTTFDGIKGETAEAIKEDTGKFALVAIEHALSVFEAYKIKAKEYKDNYSNIDDGFAVFSRDDFDKIDRKIRDSRRLIEEVSNNVDRIITGIDSIASVNIPNSHNIISAHNRMLEHLLEIIRDVEKCEKIDDEFKNVEESINVLLDFLRAKDPGTLENNFDAIVGYARGYFPDVKVDKKPGEKVKDGVGEVGAESKTFETIGNTMREVSVKYGTLGAEGPGQFIMVDQKYAKASNFFTKNADSIAGKFETLGKIGTGLTVANFITSTYKDVKDGYGVGQAILKNGLTTGGSAVGAKIGGVAATGTALLFGITGIGAVALSVGLFAYFSYKGAQAGEAAYYSFLKKDLNVNVWNEIEYFDDGIHPKPQF